MHYTSKAPMQRHPGNTTAGDTNERITCTQSIISANIIHGYDDRNGLFFNCRPVFIAQTGAKNKISL